METYHKINAPFKRHMDGPKKGRLIVGDWAVPELKYLAKNRFEFTEKVDGTNIRVRLTVEDGELYVEFGGRTDNAVIPTPLMEALETTFDNGNVATWMLGNDLTDVLLFGEGYGPKIQGGGKYMQSVIEANRKLPEEAPKQTEHKFVLFDVKIGNFWLTRPNVDDIAQKLGIDSVPTIGYGTLEDAIDIVSTGLTWDKYGKMTNWGGVENVDGKEVRRFAGLKSQWANFEAEGIVARPSVPLFDRQGNRILTKIKAVDFK